MIPEGRTNACEVYFALFGTDFDPDEVTEIVGLQPTETKRRADPIPKHSSWTVSEGKVEGDVIDVYDLSNSLISKIAPYKAEIIRAKQSFGLDAVLEVVLWISTDESISTPAIGFESEVISFLSDIGASIDVDTYRNTP